MSNLRTVFAGIANGVAIDLAAVPLLTWEQLSDAVVAGVAAGQRLCALFAADSPEPGATRLYAILADDRHNCLAAAAADIVGGAFPSLAPRCPQAHLFEREIAEQTGIRPEGHPWLKPVRYVPPLPGPLLHGSGGTSSHPAVLPGTGDFYRVAGDQVHEVAVGPVHAGVIEPGHFRFQCHGEEVFHLEIALGYQHRGVERALIGGPTPRTLHYAETLSGDSTIAHATSFCQALEAIAGIRASARAQTIRAIALELERLANHIGDLGALAGDVGFQPTASFCGRIRGDFLNMTALLCGNRFGRGLVVPGGTGFDVDPSRLGELSRRLDEGLRDATQSIEMLWDTRTVMARFEETGKVPRNVAEYLGMVGPAARAAGLDHDIRRDQPAGIFRFAQLPVATCEAGDVLSRAYVRWLEIGYSVAFIREMIGTLPAGAISTPIKPLAPGRLVVTLNEGWRGEVCHVALTGSDGRLTRYKVVDPSFHNWPGLAYAMRNQEISDFPICNKSFNLSYCGHDL